MTAEELNRYLEKSGDITLISNGVLLEDEHGFMIFDINTAEDAFCISHCYGDGEYWDQYAHDLAAKMHCKTVRFGTRRSPKAFERKYGYKIIGYILEKGV